MNKTINMSDIWLLLFGGVVSPTLTLENAFESAFNRQENLWAWKKVGACPFTRACLQDSKVRHEVVLDETGAIDVDADPVAMQLLALEDKNKVCCGVILSIGGDPSFLSAKAPRSQKKAPLSVTKPLSTEYQDRLAAASNAGTHFRLGGGTLSSDDFFVGRERKRRKDQVVALEAKKARVEAFNRLARKASTIMEAAKVAETGSVKNVKVSDLKELVKWKLFYSKSSAKIPAKKQDLVALWDKTPLPSAQEAWTDVEEAELAEMKNEEVLAHETALGEEHKRNIGVVLGGIEAGAVSNDSIVALKAAIEVFDQRSERRLPSPSTEDAQNNDEVV